APGGGVEFTIMLRRVGCAGGAEVGPVLSCDHARHQKQADEECGFWRKHPQGPNHTGPYGLHHVGVSTGSEPGRLVRMSRLISDPIDCGVRPMLARLHRVPFLTAPSQREPLPLRASPASAWFRRP